MRNEYDFHDGEKSPYSRDKQFRTSISAGTVRLIARILYPWKAEGVLPKDAYDEILLNLKHLADKGTLFPCVVPKLIKQKEAAEMLGVSFASFRQMERYGLFPFHRKMVGSSVRYRNLDIIKFIMAEDTKHEEVQE